MEEHWNEPNREIVTRSLMKRRLARAAVTACCAAGLAITQAVPAHAKTVKVRFDYAHVWKTPEFKTTATGRITFKVETCNRAGQKMTVLLRRTSGFNHDIATRTIKCSAGQTATFQNVARATYEFELGKLDDGKHFQGLASYTFTG